MRLFCVFIAFFMLFSCVERNSKILPLERDLTESVYASVTIQPDSLYQVYAVISGILDENLVEEGTMVSKDDVLIQVINSTPKLNANNAKLALDLARENYYGSAAVLSGIKDEIEAATLKYKNDSVNYFRQKNLWEQNIGSKMQYDNQKLNYQLSLNSLRLLKSRYDRTKNELESGLRRAENNYETALITTRDFAVKSKINGKVYALYKEPGEIVNTMEPIAAVGSATRFVIDMLVDEVDIVKITEGQKVIIHLDAYKGDVFEASVSKIYPKKDQRNQTFKVEAVFNEAPKVLYPGLSGEANIIIAKKSNVLCIPKSYLIENNKVKTDDGLVAVVTGLQNLEYIEILSGIEKNTYLYKPE